ncbi:tetratricopeptide repeat protein [Candidatus Dependentiae bacterium]|nr:tetratricopeptide repeat protein [Candidatus Dependentiae bacterium]
MGKSQLALQFIEKINDSVSLLTMESDSILKNSLNPVVYFLNKHFDQTNISDYAEKKKNFEKKFFFIINELSKSKIDYYKNLSDELIRTKSLIAGLIGIYYENSLYYKLDSQARYENTLYAVKELIKAESAIKPVILLIEDFHWIDEDTKNFLHILITNPEKINLLIIATARFNDDGSKPVLFPAGLLRQNHLELKSFDKNNVNEMIRIQLKAEPNNDLFQFILRKSEGNPFYIEQICTYLRENNLIRKKEKKIRLIKGKIEIPSSIQSLIISRIDRLSSELKEITQVASVIGREFDITILANMINILARGISKKNNSNTDYYNANNGIGGINDIVISGKTENIWSELSEFIYLFKHILLREAAYSMQLKARLKSLHFTAASAMEKMFKNDKRFALEIAYHFDKAGIIIQTKKYLYIAGEFSRDNYKMDIALRVYSRLYELSDSDSEKMNINIIQADIYENIGAFDKAIETVKRGLKLIKNKNDLQIELKLKNILGIVYWKKSLLKEAEKEFIEIINFSKKIKVNTEISNALRHLGIIYMDRGDFDSAVDYYSHSLKICRVLNDKINLGWNTFSLGYAYYEIKADYAQAQKYYDRTLKIFKNINFDYGILICLRSFGFIFHYNLIDYNKALFYYHGSLEISEKLGRKRDICYVLNKISDVNILQGKLFSALENYNKSLEIAEELGDAVQISSSLNQIANINGMLCKFDIAHTALDKAYSICNHTKNESQFYWLAYAKALVYIYQSDYKNAAKYLSESVRIGEKTGIINMIGARYGYLAYCYVKLKLYCKAVDFIYKSFITISKLGGNDVLYGRTHLASAMLANAVPEFSKDERSKKIFELTGLDFNPDTYFNNAISIAEKSDFNETLIPALYEYAAYLSRIGQKIKSEKILNRSFEAAKRLGWTYELKKIEKSVKNQKAKFNNNKFSIL